MKLLSYQQVAELAGVPVGTVYAWVSRKRIPHIRLGPRLVRFDPAELTAWIDEHRVALARQTTEDSERNVL